MEERGKRAGQTSLAPQLYVKEITPSEVRGTTNIFLFLIVCGDIYTMMKFHVMSCRVIPRNICLYYNHCHQLLLLWFIEMKFFFFIHLHLFCFSLNLFWLACRKSNVSNTYDDGHDVIDRSLIYNCLPTCKAAYNFSPSFFTSTSYPPSTLFLFSYFLNFFFAVYLVPLSIFFLFLSPFLPF